MDSTFAEVSCYLLKEQNFYARVLSGIQIEESSQVPMMCVRIVNRHFCVSFNPDWVQKAVFLDIQATLHHEVLHIILSHIPRGIDLYSQCATAEEKKLFTTLNPLAVDMAVNCFLVNVDDYTAAHLEEWIMPDEPRFDLPRDKAYEWYYSQLKQRSQKDPSFKKMVCELVGQNSKLQNHTGWQQILEEFSTEELQGLQQELDYQTKTLVSKAVSVHHKSRGTVPTFLQEYIEALLKPPVVPWLTILKNKVIHTKRYRRKRGLARPNRRYFGIPQLLPFPGKTKDRTFTVGFLIDTSGSMIIPELEVAYSELQHLQKVDPDILLYIIEADAGVAREYEAGPETKIKPDFKGRGGTDFNPALIRIKELKPDIVFYYTDGEAPAPLVCNRVDCPFIWLLTSRSKIPDTSWGDVIKMEDK